MEGLTRLDEDSTAQAGVAEDWDVSDDGLTYTFYLRDDANWSNGDAVVAEDFIYAWTLMLDPETIPPSPAAFLAYFIEGAEDFNSGDGSADDLALQAIDEKTLEVVLEHPTGFFLDLLTNPAFFPINHQVAEEDPGWHAEADTCIANSKLRIDSCELDSEMMLAKTDEYWDRAADQLVRTQFTMGNSENTK